MNQRRDAESKSRRAPGQRGFFDWGLPALLSLLLHVAPLLALWFLAHVPLLAPPLPIEIRPAHPVGPRRETPPPQRETPPPGPRKPAGGPGRAKAKRASRPAPVPAPTPPPEPPAPPVPAPTDLHALGPGESSRIVILLRTDRLRSSPYRAPVESLLSLLPDYQTFLAGTGLSLVDRFDALLLATDNPYDVTATFLAARHGDDPQLREALGQRTLPTWDPRVVRFVEPTLSVLARPDGAARLDRALERSDAGVAADEGAAKWLDTLRHVEKLADEPGAPALLVTVSGLPTVARLQGLPTPLSMSLAMGAEAGPALRLSLQFTDEASAHTFVMAWPDIVKQWRTSTSLIGLGGALDQLVAKQAKERVQVEGRIGDAQMQLGLTLAQALMPRPAAVGVDAGSGSPAAPPPLPSPTSPLAPAPTSAPAPAPASTPAVAPEGKRVSGPVDTRPPTASIDAGTAGTD
ncbi:MAG TPA: hypothetical protein VH877_18585 [Polyangia bacterium]|nr:hypothetical protein [Polyangia bacterium]